MPFFAGLRQTQHIRSIRQLPRYTEREKKTRTKKHEMKQNILLFVNDWITLLIFDFLRFAIWFSSLCYLIFFAFLFDFLRFAIWFSSIDANHYRALRKTTGSCANLHSAVHGVTHSCGCFLRPSKQSEGPSRALVRSWGGIMRDFWLVESSPKTMHGFWIGWK